jgi:hypothetical protein
MHDTNPQHAAAEKGLEHLTVSPARISSAVSFVAFVSRSFTLLSLHCCACTCTSTAVLSAWHSLATDSWPDKLNPTGTTNGCRTSPVQHGKWLADQPRPRGTTNGCPMSSWEVACVAPHIRIIHSSQLQTNSFSLCDLTDNNSWEKPHAQLTLYRQNISAPTQHRTSSPDPAHTR